MNFRTISNLSEKESNFYRPEIDGLRAFAIFAVVINHFNEKILPSGYLGVDIFFVISGYVITCSLAKRRFDNFQDFITGFYIRRIRRLIPALLFFILITDILICFFNPDPRYSIKTSISAIFGISNLYIFNSSFDYFSKEIELNPFAHTWSLGVEEQFYFIFPLIIWISGFGVKKIHSIRNLSLIISSISITSLISFVYFYKSNFPAAYLLMPNRIWEMGLGCLVFLLLQKQKKFIEFIKNIPPSVFFLGIICVMFLPTSFGITATLSIVFLSSFLIITLQPTKPLFYLFSLRPIVYFGLLSYSIYLWHWGILSISRWTIGINAWTLPFQILLILLFSVFSYECIEKPIRTKLSFVTRKNIFIFGIGSILASSISIYFLIYKNISNLFLGKIDDQNNPLIFFNDNDTGLKADLCHSRRAKELSINDKNIVFNCLYKSQQKNRFISVIGDSNALAYMPTISEVAKNLDSSYFHFSKDACAQIIDSEIDNNCNKDAEKIIRLVKDLSSGYKNKNLIIVKSFSNKYNSKQKKVLQQNLSSIIKLLDKTGTKIIITLPITGFEEFPGSPICMDQWFKYKSQTVNSCFEKIDINKVNKHRDYIKSIFKSLKNESNNLHFFDPTPFLCESSHCATNRKGSYIYHDGSHLSGESKKWLANPLQNYLEKI